MNRILADVAAFMNGIAAVVIMFSVAATVYQMNPTGVGFLIGLFVGVAAASVVCGLIANLVEIRRELVRLNGKNLVVN